MQEDKNSNNNQKKEKCEAGGGIYADGNCIIKKDSKDSKEPVTTEKSALEDAILQKVNSKKLPIAGYWVHYGNGQFDWLYISSDGKTIATIKGEIKWQRLKSDNVRVKIDNKTVTILPKKMNEQETPKEPSSKKKREQKSDTGGAFPTER